MLVCELHLAGKDVLDNDVPSPSNTTGVDAVNALDGTSIVGFGGDGSNSADGGSEQGNGELHVDDALLKRSRKM